MYSIWSSYTLFDLADVKGQCFMLDVTIGEDYSSEISDAQLKFSQKLQDVKKDACARYLWVTTW